MAIADIKKGIEEINKCKHELEQKVSNALLEFEKSTGLQIESLGFVRHSFRTESGIETDFKYLTESSVLLK